MYVREVVLAQKSFGSCRVIWHCTQLKGFGIDIPKAVLGLTIDPVPGLADTAGIEEVSGLVRTLVTSESRLFVTAAVIVQDITLKGVQVAEKTKSLRITGKNPFHRLHRWVIQI